MSFVKRLAIFMSIVLSFFSVAGAQSSSSYYADTASGAIVIGDPNAKITLYDFSSFSCPYCKIFHEETLPQIKKDFVDTGKIRVIFMPMSFHPIITVASMLPFCAVGSDNVKSLVDAEFSTQEEWLGSKDPTLSLQSIAFKYGKMNKNDFNQCIAKESLYNTITNNSKAIGSLGLTGTPSFLIKLSNEPLDGKQSFFSSMKYPEFKKTINAVLVKNGIEAVK